MTLLTLDQINDAIDLYRKHCETSDADFIEPQGAGEHPQGVITLSIENNAIASVNLETSQVTIVTRITNSDDANVAKRKPERKPEREMHP